MRTPASFSLGSLARRHSQPLVRLPLPTRPAPTPISLGPYLQPPVPARSASAPLNPPVPAPSLNPPSTPSSSPPVSTPPSAPSSSPSQRKKFARFWQATTGVRRRLDGDDALRLFNDRIPPRLLSICGVTAGRVEGCDAGAAYVRRSLPKSPDYFSLASKWGHRTASAHVGEGCWGHRTALAHGGAGVQASISSGRGGALGASGGLGSRGGAGDIGRPRLAWGALGHRAVFALCAMGGRARASVRQVLS